MVGDNLDDGSGRHCEGSVILTRSGCVSGWALVECFRAAPKYLIQCGLRVDLLVARQPTEAMVHTTEISGLLADSSPSV
jgi:hypothetical protein